MRYPLPLLLLLLPTVALAAPVPKEVKKPTEFYPAKPGARWEYSTDDGKTIDHTREVTAVEETDGVRTAFVSYTRGGQEQKWEFRIDREGVYRTKQSGHAFDPPHLILKTRLEAGDEWEGTYSFGGAGEYRHKRSVGKPEEVTVPAGKFTAFPIVNVNVLDTTEKSTFWYAAGVGLVKYNPAGQPTVVLAKFVAGENAKEAKK